ncbi:uncharacterized protein LOC104584567 [Brachypodium distachyon]|uniref:Uncharacterized protein n=1 Tax=Brachypodium distachyon TaxID=15368 RepID=A0A0Q3PH84_BRADI|nr:uncharacterized protein LOC104584567 [Brachypodium distachyon]KQJ88681.1 hypothetical protein BRADI_4g20539v3 [Brachypodium distachyon]|eukprot:XP_014758762.1 uncharacterized protein LOC104584567 [Brachypodium distachyon]
MAAQPRWRRRGERGALERPSKRLALPGEPRGAPRKVAAEAAAVGRASAPTPIMATFPRRRRRLFLFPVRGEVRCQVVSAFVLVGGEVCLVRAVSSSGHVTPTAALVRLITRLISFSLIFLERMCRGEGSRGGRLLFDFPHIWSMADYARARLLSFACCTLTVTICDGWGSIQERAF